MDRSFGSPLVGRSPFSPRSRQNISSKRVLPQSFRKSSRFSVSGKSTQSVQIILSTPYNYVERFGQPLPVLITEALTFADRNTVVSARISRSGYAWVVCGRRLLIWQYRQSISYHSDTPQKKSGLLNQCFELQLPQSDLAHRAELVSVFVNDGSNTPSCIAVSPEGVVRYWPAIVHEGVSVEQHVNLQGQECDSLTDVEGLGCVLATTTCTVLLIQPQLSGGRHTLKSKTLKIPTGWLGGISKRMSSLIFGPIATENSAESGIVRVLSVNNNDTWTVYVLADHNLQKWLVSKNDHEELIFVAELNRMVRDSFRSTLWDNCVGDQTEIDTWLLDIQSDKDSVIILAAAANIPFSPRVHYAMISFQTNTNQPPVQVKDFLLLKMTDLYRENNSTDALSYRLLLCGTYAYLYNQKCITVIKPQEEPDTLEFNTPQDFLLAGAICVNTPIFFSRNHGLVAISSNDMSNDLNLSVTCPNTPIDTSFNENVVVNNLSIYNMDPDEICSGYKDAVNQLKAALIFHVKNQERAYKEIVNELFPQDASKLPGIDSLLDRVTVMMCKELLDDIPAGDPRWRKETPLGIGSSYSMQVLHQLEDKQKAHSLFMIFLKDSGLWSQLAASTIRNTTMATVYVLGEMAEKLAAAIALKNHSNKTLEKAIERAIAEWETQPERGLTPMDIFFREITQVHKGVQEMVNYCEDISHSNMNPSQIVDIIHETNDIVLNMLKEVLKYRERNSALYKPSETITTIAPDFLPWTAASGSEGLFDSLSQMHFLTYNYGIILTNNDRLKSDLFDQLVAITDVILDGRKSHLDSIKNTALEEILYKQYCADRQKFMKPFVQEKEWERAAKLAEKYLDFDTLIIICESTENQRRLDDYLERFSNNGFSEHVYNWFLKENKQGKLIDMCKHVGKSKNIQKLTNFLSEQPTLAWMQDIFDKKYNHAADTLQGLAAVETESVTRQKTMYSLCKLAKLAAPTHDSDSYVRIINAKLNLIAYQEDIPDYVLQQFGYDTVNIKVIPPKDLIGLYICKEYKEAGDLEFKKALDLLAFIDDDELKQELSLRIWRSALLRDIWDHRNLDSPLEILQNKLFFKLVDLAMVLEGDGWNLLPPLDTLLDDDSLKDLQDSSSFQFLIKAGYEHIYRTQSVK